MTELTLGRDWPVASRSVGTVASVPASHTISVANDLPFDDRSGGKRQGTMGHNPSGGSAAVDGMVCELFSRPSRRRQRSPASGSIHGSFPKPWHTFPFLD